MLYAHAIFLRCRSFVADEIPRCCSFVAKLAGFFGVQSSRSYLSYLILFKSVAKLEMCFRLSLVSYVLKFRKQTPGEGS